VVVSPGDPASVHAALRAGRPLALCPAFSDHASWASCAARLGACPADCPPLARALAGDALSELVSAACQPAAAAAAAAVAAAMALEGDALSAAVRFHARAALGAAARSRPRRLVAI
jgi:UDP:flavonoid glycosyltransferase YjiC (YdhE family)